MSSAIARNIFRMFSACCSSWVWVLNFDSFVTPSTRLGDLRPELLLDVVEAVFGVLGDVVEDGGGDGHRIDADVGEDLSRGQRMSRRTARPRHAAVRREPGPRSRKRAV